MNLCVDCLTRPSIMTTKKYNTGIYQLVNQVNGKRYIGSAIDLYDRERCHYKDFKKGVHRNNYLQKAYNKYGKDNFKFEILLHCSKENLLFYEQRAIDAYDFRNELYNIAPIAGNSLGIKRSDETRGKISQSRKGEKSWLYGKPGITRGRKLSEEHKGKLSKAGKGRKLSEEHKRKIGLAHKGCKHTEESKEKVSKAKKGKKLSEEHKKSISEGQKGHIVTLETRKKIGEAHKGRKYPEEIKEKHYKPVKAYIYKTGEFVGEYKSLKKCTEILNIYSGKISSVLNKNRKQHKGYTFEYVNKEDKTK